MSKLNKLGITVSAGNKAETVFDSLFPDFLEISYTSPSQYVDSYWQQYLKHPETNNNLNGRIFEFILATLFVREGIFPLYLSAKVAFVPNVIYDLMFYSQERGPVCISAKTSLRERYKQADLEAFALKNVHRRALCYLITLDETEARGVKNKINSGDIIGLDNVIVAQGEEFNQFIAFLKTLTFIEPPTVKVVQSNQVITSDRALSIKE